MLGMAYLVIHVTLYAFCTSRGCLKLRNKSWLNDLYGEDNVSKCRCASVPPYNDFIYWFIKPCTIFALLSYKFMIINSFTNNLYGLPCGSHTRSSDMAYS